MKVTLKDGAPRSKGEVEINVSKNGNTVEIGATGVEPAPVVLEFYEGKLTLRVYGSNLGDDATYKTTLNIVATPAAAKPARIPGVGEAEYTAKRTIVDGKPVLSDIKKTEPAPAAEPTDDDMAAFDAA